MTLSPTEISTPDAQGRTRLRRSLLAWYQKNRRDLPWRRTDDPYAIWISEAMLQQTRVATVIDYWRRFLQAFPTVEALASAREEAVLAQWSGLGYYSRARSLHAAAQAIVQHHGGRFPRELSTALALPGVGPYTGGAVLSIAYDLPEPLVDGNVERVFTRVLGLPGASGESALRKRTWQVAAEFVPQRGASQWNQALMELGALVCTAASPDCAACPWKGTCAAKASGNPQGFPAPKKRKAPQDLHLQALWITSQRFPSQGISKPLISTQSQGQTTAPKKGGILLAQRPSPGAMAKLWELPTRRIESSPESHLWGLAWPGGGDPLPGDLLLEQRHAITHHRIAMRVHEGSWPGPLAESMAWFAPEALKGVPVTGLTKKAIAHLGTTGTAP